MENGGLAFRLLGTYTFTGTLLHVELSNMADGNVIAGPILVERVSDGTKSRVQNNRDPQTLVPILPAPGVPDPYADDGASWTDLAYPTGTGHDPLWESALLRPAFKELFTDWQNGALNFPDLGDPTVSDPNSTSIAKAELPSHATPFGRFAPPADIEYSILGGTNLTLRFVEDGLGQDVLQLYDNDAASVVADYLIGDDTVLAVKIHPSIDLGTLSVGGQFEDTLTLDLGFTGTPDAGARPSLHITFDGADEILPDDLTSVNDRLIVQTTGGTPFTLGALDIQSTEAVEVNGNISVLGEMSIDVAASDAAQYSALVDLVWANSTAAVDVLGGTINAGSVYLTAVSTQILNVAGFELGGFQVGVLNSISNARVSVEGSSSIVTTSGGINIGASSAVLAHNVLASDPGGDADTDAAVASTTVFTDAFARVSGTATLDSAAEVIVTAGNSADSKAIADGSAGGAGATLGFSLVIADTEASIDEGATVVDASSMTVTANADFTLDVQSKATPGGTSSEEAGLITIDPSAPGVVDTGADSIDLGADHGLKDGDRVVYHHGDGGSDIGGLEDGKAYFVNMTDNEAKLYNTKDQAVAGGTEGLRDLTSTGAGTAHTIKKTSRTQSTLADPNQDGNTEDAAKTSDGEVKFAAALAGAGLESNTRAFVGSSAPLTTTGALTIDSQSAASVSAKADGSSTVTEEGSTNLGIAVGVSVGVLTTEATVGGTGLVTAGSLTAQAHMKGADTFVAEATSGASGGDTGVAGALAVNVVTSRVEAKIADGTSVVITGGGDVSITAKNEVSTNTKSTGKQEGGGDTGVGASVALNIVDTDTLALVGTGAVITGADEVNMSATSKNDSDTTAQGGSAGGTAVTPVVSIALMFDDTAAETRTGGVLTLTGALAATATHEGDINTNAAGEAEGTDTAVGASLGLTIAAEMVAVALMRNVTAGGRHRRHLARHLPLAHQREGERGRRRGRRPRLDGGRR